MTEPFGPQQAKHLAAQLQGVPPDAADGSSSDAPRAPYRGVLCDRPVGRHASDCVWPHD